MYSLGATLYCLLTGRVPFDGEIGEVLRKVQRGEFPPPRQVAPSIDRALEAVCLKAMANHPEDRYATCRALADDVERWTADEPVAAWAEPWTRTLLRWLTRHRTGVTGATAAGLAGVLGLFAVLAVQASANAQLSDALDRETRAGAALADANAGLTRSKAAVQARYNLAVDAIKTFHTGVSEDFLLKQDQFKELRDRLLESAADFYRRKLGALLGDEADGASRRALARSNYELADLTWKVGRSEDALAAHRAVLATREALAAEPGADAVAVVEVGRSLTTIGSLLEVTGRTDDALAAYRRAESLLAGADGPAPAALAACRSALGSLLARRGELSAALEAYKLARSDQEAVAAGPGASNEALHDLASTRRRTGDLLSSKGNPADADAEYREALTILEKLAGENPAVPDFRSDLAATRHRRGWLLNHSARLADAEADYREAMTLLEKLADENPAVSALMGELAQTHNDLGLLLLQTGRLGMAESECRAGLAINRKLVDDHPADANYRRGLSIALARLGMAQTQQGRASEAADAFRKAVEVLKGLPAMESSDLYNVACFFSLLSATPAAPGSSGADGEGRAQADQAMEALRRAVAAGFRDLPHMQADSDLDPLRGRDDFKLLMMDLAIPADPFAAAE
ncbi:tetratricopeptide repeat protein [Planctomyces sp. SH-PL62]|uniref:tetratricopeptide repeat protein n=1 Tax=Planctomyces sp. SH-PL62 TaxID=1636152 RepID=UPI00078B43C9|nr:tetratricopeptide repeat protein [Planctomyces sp. SH-PL62]AMV41022.1 Tyrosine-protein kinase MasK [Planctomyces sp. SH-PL62]